MYSAHICYTHSSHTQNEKNQLYDQVDENKLQIYKIGSVSDTRIPTRALFCIILSELKEYRCSREVGVDKSKSVSMMSECTAVEFGPEQRSRVAEGSGVV